MAVINKLNVPWARSEIDAYERIERLTITSPPSGLGLEIVGVAYQSEEDRFAGAPAMPARNPAVRFSLAEFAEAPEDETPEQEAARLELLDQIAAAIAVVYPLAYRLYKLRYPEAEDRQSDLPE